MRDIENIMETLKTKGLTDCSALLFVEDQGVVFDTYEPDDQDVRNLFDSYVNEYAHPAFHEGLIRLSYHNGEITETSIDDMAMAMDPPPMSDELMRNLLAEVPFGSAVFVMRKEDAADEGISCWVSETAAPNGFKLEVSVVTEGPELSMIDMRLMAPCSDDMRSAASAIDGLSGSHGGFVFHAPTEMCRCVGEVVVSDENRPMSCLPEEFTNALRDITETVKESIPIASMILSSPCFVFAFTEGGGVIRSVVVGR